VEAGLLAQQNRFLLVFYQFRFYNGDARFLREFLGFKFGGNGSPLILSLVEYGRWSQRVSL